jgi:hypothetical protein
MKICIKYFRLVLIIGFLITLISCNNRQNANFKNKGSNDSTINKTSKTPTEVARQDTFIYSIHKGLPDYKFILLIDEYTFINEIQVYLSTDSNLVQRIFTDSLSALVQRTPESDQYFFTKDFNFDGYEDIVLLEDCGVTGNQTYGVWLYNKSKKIFETNDFFIRIDRPTLDKDKKQITTFLNYGGADEYLYKTYKLINKQFVLMSEVYYWRGEKAPMKDSSARIGDTLRLISRRIVN